MEINDYMKNNDCNTIDDALCTDIVGKSAGVSVGVRLAIWIEVF